jgi:thioredoxin 2
MYPPFPAASRVIVMGVRRPSGIEVPMSESLVFRCPSCGGLNRVQPERLASGPTCGRCKTELDVSGAPVHLSDDQLARLVAKSPVPVLVDFYADWCGPCRAIAPSLEKLGREHAGRLVVAKIDTERHQRTAQELSVRGIPALFLYRGGRVIDQKAGALSLPALRSWVAPKL